MTVPAHVVLPKLRRLVGGASPRVVDLFSGCGGMSLGFRSAGFDILAGVELEPIRAQTHAANVHRHLGKEMEALHARALDVTDAAPRSLLLLGTFLPQVDVLVGGPPCPAYVRVGRAKLREIAQHPTAYRNTLRRRLREVGMWLVLPTSASAGEAHSA